MANRGETGRSRKRVVSEPGRVRRCEVGHGKYDVEPVCQKYVSGVGITARVGEMNQPLDGLRGESIWTGELISTRTA